MHLTSQVILASSHPASGPIDVLRATLPPGTLLVRAQACAAMEIIDDLEPTKRGIYGGVNRLPDFSGNATPPFAIRTMVVAPDGRGLDPGGAGIVADSDPASEERRVLAQGCGLLAAVGAAGAWRPCAWWVRRDRERRAHLGSWPPRSVTTTRCSTASRPADRARCGRGPGP